MCLAGTVCAVEAPQYLCRLPRASLVFSSLFSFPACVSIRQHSSRSDFAMTSYLFPSDLLRSESDFAMTSYLYPTDLLWLNVPCGHSLCRGGTSVSLPPPPSWSCFLVSFLFSSMREHTSAFVNRHNRGLTTPTTSGCYTHLKVLTLVN